MILDGNGHRGRPGAEKYYNSYGISMKLNATFASKLIKVRNSVIFTKVHDFLIKIWEIMIFLTFSCFNAFWGGCCLQKALKPIGIQYIPNKGATRP